MSKRYFIAIISCLIIPTITPQPPQQKPNVDISCCIADLKFDGNIIKICEFGLCTWSIFKGHESLYGYGKVWESIWKYLHTFDIPIWYVGNLSLSDKKRQEVGYNKLIDCYGAVFPKLDSLMKNPLFQNTLKKKVHDHSMISAHQGILVLHRHKEDKETINAFRKNYPGIIIMDTAAAPYVNNKAKSNALFTNDLTQAMKPAWRVYPKIYTPTQANEIIKEFDYETYVIKPINSAEGKGIIMVQKKELDKTLKLIFTKQTSAKKTSDTSYNYWEKDSNDTFIIEAYAPSKPIEVEDHWYDATMRVVFALSYEQQKTKIHFLAHYWKLPTKHLYEPGSLNDKHKSKVAPGKISSAIVCEADIIQVEKLMRLVLPPLYENMYQETLTYDFDRST